MVSGIHAKLAVGQPGDTYEQEADMVAEQVLRTAEPAVQRQAEEEDIQAKQLPSQTLEIVLDVEPASTTPGVTASLCRNPLVLTSSRASVVTSAMHLHSDAQAAESARAVNATQHTRSL